MANFSEQLEIKNKVDSNLSLLLGVDLGTGGCKITVINLMGEIVAEASEEYTTFHPHPSWSEQNPDDWFKASISCLNKISRHENIDMARILAVALDGSTHNAVLLDKNMNVIRPTIMWTDQRSQEEAEYLENLYGPEIYRITYQKVAPTWTLPQLLWIKKNEPDNFGKIHRIMFVKDYVRFLLTGIWVTDFIDAQGTLFYDMANNQWSAELCKLIGLPMEVLPPLRSPTDIAGKITSTAAEVTRLSPGTLVICGTSDVTVEDYAAGAIKPGQCIIKLATAGNVNIMKAKANPNPRLITYSHVIPGLWYSAAATNTAAYAMRWFRDNFCLYEVESSGESGINIYQQMENLTDSIPSGSEGLIFHPYLLGERAPYWDPNLRASFIGASMSHTKGHFIKAVMEGVAYSLRDCYSLIEKSNSRVTEFILIGGGAKSDLWSQIICDVFGKKVIRPSVVDASYGSALLAGVGAGIYPNAETAVETCVKTNRTFEPNIHNYLKYNELFKLYLKIHENLKDIYKDLNKVINSSK